MNKRLLMLEKMVASGGGDSFARYALALEYKKEERYADAANAFDQLRAADPEYLPQYLMAGQMHLDNKSMESARDWLEAGLAIAKRQGDVKAIGEIDAALADLL